MKLISSQSDAEVEQKKIEAELRGALRTVVANLMRVMRGSGKPDQLGRDVAFCAGAFASYHAAFGRHPAREFYFGALNLQAVLEEHRPWVKEAFAEARGRWDEDGTTDRMEAKQAILRGAMQIIASRMLDQMTQENRGEQELHEGIGALRKSRKSKG